MRFQCEMTWANRVLFYAKWKYSCGITTTEFNSACYLFYTLLLFFVNCIHNMDKHITKLSHRAVWVSQETSNVFKQQIKFFWSLTNDFCWLIDCVAGSVNIVIHLFSCCSQMLHKKIYFLYQVRLFDMIRTTSPNFIFYLTFLFSHTVYH